MNKLEFGEVVFGGNLAKNLKIEANMNKKIEKERIKEKTQASYRFINSLIHPSSITMKTSPTATLTSKKDPPQYLKKHNTKKMTAPLNNVFTKIPSLVDNKDLDQLAFSTFNNTENNDVIMAAIMEQ